MRTAKQRREYISELENVIGRYFQRFNGMPIGFFMKGFARLEIVKFNSRSPEHKRLLENLQKAAEIASQAVTSAGGIIRPRPNEVANDIEANVEDALKAVGYNDACKPTGTSGKGKSGGYPDREFSASGTPVYLEVKSYAIKSVGSSFRSFYLSPSDNFKVNKTGLHLVIAFEVIKKNDAYFVAGWKIITVNQLMVDIKYEFNSDNKRLYAANAILAEKKFDYSVRV